MRALLLTVALLAACAPEDDPDTPDTTETPAQALHDAVVGVWTPVEPGLFDVGGDPVSFDSVVFREDGSATFTWVGLSNGLLSCFEVRWDTTDHSVILDFEASELTLFLFDGLWSASITEGQLSLTSDVGVTTVLEAVEAVPDGRTCLTATIVDEVDASRGLYSDADLLYAASAETFYLSDPDMAQLDPVYIGGGSVMSMPWFLTTSSLRQALALDDAQQQVWLLDWTMDHLLQCRTRLDADCGVVDTMALGSELEITSATMDDAGNLWLHGRSTTGTRQFLEVDPSGPTVLGTLTFDAELGPLTWHDGALWAVTTDGNGGPLVEIDPVSGQVLRNVRIPSLPRILNRWRGLASTGDALWAAFESQFEEDDGVVLRALSVPTSE